MIEQMTLTDFLSFGPGSHTIELRDLNVIIGPNGSGKSNLVEAFSFLRSVPRDLPLPIREGGGVDEWIWRGSGAQRPGAAAIEVIFRADEVAKQSTRYRVAFGSEAGGFVVLDERIENSNPREGQSKPYFYFGYESAGPMLNNASGHRRALERADIDRTQSILSQRRDPEIYPEVAATGDRLGEIRIYRDWSFGPHSRIRTACAAGVRTDHLLEDFTNLPARLAVLRRTPATKKRLLGLLSDVASGFSDIDVVPEGGQLRLYLTEGDRSVPAHRLSDGTLRYLSLLAILLDPGAARLVVIEEPELGLHPDVLPTIRDLLVEASERFQLVVTTHSTQLVDTLTGRPDSIVVCEKDGPTSTLTRLDPARIARWQELGSLGSVWLSGRIGGTRW